VLLVLVVVVMLVVMLLLLLVLVLALMRLPMAAPRSRTLHGGLLHEQLRSARLGRAKLASVMRKETHSTLTALPIGA